MTGTRAANALAREADLVLCVGTRLIDLTTGSHSLFEHPDVRFVGLNVVARDAHKLGALPLVADAKLGLRALAEALRAAGWQAPDEWRARALVERERWEARSPRTCGHARPNDDAGAGAPRAQRGRRAARLADRASGTPHVDVHKLWDPERGERCLMEVGFSCMARRDPRRDRRADGAARRGRGLRGHRRRHLPDGRERRARQRSPAGDQDHRPGLRERRLPVDPRPAAQPHRPQLRAGVPRTATASTSRSTTARTRAASGCAAYRATTVEQLRRRARGRSGRDPGPS